VDFRVRYTEDFMSKVSNVKLEADKTKIAQVIRNLLAFAIKCSELSSIPNKSVFVEISIFECSNGFVTSGRTTTTTESSFYRRSGAVVTCPRSVDYIVLDMTPTDGIGSPTSQGDTYPSGVLFKLCIRLRTDGPEFSLVSHLIKFQEANEYLLLRYCFDCVCFGVCYVRRSWLVCLSFIRLM
jgi:hypothetical protein